MSKTALLDRITGPDALKRLKSSQLEELCAEIRTLLISVVTQNGGHLASNLGVVELTVALHRVFSTPYDQIVWDVGHQCYVHKLLTGRRAQFDTLRLEDGLSGFPKRAESRHDAFIAGHASTSLSVACGLARAKRLSGDSSSVIAVIGDGAFTSGLAFEGLNNAGRSEENLIIILNENERSISKNVGAFARYLASIRTSGRYFRAKDNIRGILKSVPVVGDGLSDIVSASKSVAKGVLYHSNFFEDLGFIYFGPVDGHDLASLQEVLFRAKQLKRPVFIHIQTVKGKGYTAAENNPGKYHGLSGNGSKLPGREPEEASSFSDEFGLELTRLAKQDERICAVTAAMKYGTGLNHFSDAFKGTGRFIDVGIAEGHGVTFSAALAANGRLPVFALYSSFLQRGYDQVLHDACIEPQHIVLGVDRAGIVGADGETHQGLFDVSFMTAIPNVTIYSPYDYATLKYAMHKALYECRGVCSVRYPRGAQPHLPEGFKAPPADWNFVRQEGAKLLIITYGRLYAQAAQAALNLKEQGIPTDILNLVKIFPLGDAATERAMGYDTVVFVEEGMRRGSIAEMLGIRLLERGFAGRYAIRAVDGKFVPAASVSSALHQLGLDSAGIQALAESLA